MKALIRRYLNDIVSLTVLTLMAVALVAAQTGASARLTSHAAIANDLSERFELRVTDFRHNRE